MTLIPLMASKLLSRMESKNPCWTEWLTEKYVSILHWTFRHRWATFGVTVAIPLSIALPFMLGLQTAMFTGINKNQMYMQYDFSDFHYKEDAEAAVAEVEQWFFEHHEELQLESVYSYFSENGAATTLTFAKEDGLSVRALAHPSAILVSTPFALWGAAWFLWATNSPFNLMGQIGVLILMGIVVKNGIVLIDHINNLRRQGYSREEAIELGGRGHPRPDSDLRQLKTTPSG